MNRNRVHGPGDAVAVIHYEYHGRKRRWTIGCYLPRDTPDTLRAHLARWMPGAIFLECEFRPLDAAGVTR